MYKIEIELPSTFSFSESLRYLNRNALECLHTVTGSSISKLIDIDGRLILIHIEQSRNGKLFVQFDSRFHKDAEKIKLYILEWLDIDRNMDPIWQVLGKDSTLTACIKQHRGIRVIKIPELLEALTWAIIGQQINLTFAYQVKRNLVLAFGRSIEQESRTYFIFPTAEKLCNISDQEFRQMKFSRQKIKYVRTVAEKIVGESWSKDRLSLLPDYDLKSELISVSGVGDWTSEYVMLRCFGRMNAFPAADAGLKKAMFIMTGNKYSTDDLLKRAESWKPYRGYAAYYLWNSLYTHD